MSYVSTFIHEVSYYPGGIMIEMSNVFRVLSGGILFFLFTMPQGADLASAAEDVKATSM